MVVTGGGGVCVSDRFTSNSTIRTANTFNLHYSWWVGLDRPKEEYLRFSIDSSSSTEVVY